MEFFSGKLKKGVEGDFDMVGGDFYKDFDDISKFDSVTSISEDQINHILNTANHLPEKNEIHPQVIK